MERPISEKERELILNCGAFEYDAVTCAAVLGWDVEDVEALMKDDDSEFKKCYITGKLRAEYVIDLKLFEQAQAGDVKSLEKLEHRKRIRKK